ncbi:MAG: phage holin family protein [Bacteroidales bacterium]|nr:phage holin family protein [Bacteroidales bacterium]
MAGKTELNTGFQKLFTEVKDYVELRLDYMQVGMVEKLTKLISKLLVLFIAIVFGMAVLFYLLFSLAYALAPMLGFITSFAIIAGIFLLLTIIVIVFRKSLIVNPILKLMVEVFYDDTKENKEDDENNTATS